MAVPLVANADPSVADPDVYSAPGYRSSSSAGESGFYFAADIGVSLLENFNSFRFGGPGSYSADPGVRFSLEPGYKFRLSDSFDLGAEFETGFIYNHFSSVSIDNSYRYPVGYPQPYTGEYYQTPFLGNLVLNIHLGPVTPYVGVGGGGIVSTTAIHLIYDSNDWNLETDADPAFEAMAGVRFRVGRACSLGVGYKFLEGFATHGDNIITHAAFATCSFGF